MLSMCIGVDMLSMCIGVNLLSVYWCKYVYPPYFIMRCKFVMYIVCYSVLVIWH